MGPAVGSAGCFLQCLYIFSLNIYCDKNNLLDRFVNIFREIAYKSPILKPVLNFSIAIVFLLQIRSIL